MIGRLNSSEVAAKAAGVSIRHFRRLAEALKIKPVILGSHAGGKFFFTQTQIEAIRNRAKATPKLSIDRMMPTT